MKVQVRIIDTDGTVLQQDHVLVSLSEYEAFERRLNGWNPANWLANMIEPFITKLITEE